MPARLSWPVAPPVLLTRLRTAGKAARRIRDPAAAASKAQEVGQYLHVDVGVAVLGPKGGAGGSLDLRGRLRRGPSGDNPASEPQEVCQAG